VLSNELN